MCGMVVASSAVTSVLHEICKPEVEVAASISVCVIIPIYINYIYLQSMGELQLVLLHVNFRTVQLAIVCGEITGTYGLQWASITEYCLVLLPSLFYISLLCFLSRLVCVCSRCGTGP